MASSDLPRIERLPGSGWLALLGGGELTFGETEGADEAWLAKAGEGTVAFLPAASGSQDYGVHFATYLAETFGRVAETVPVYRLRDGRRERNAGRVAAAAAVYLGGGLAEQLLDAVEDTPVLAALEAKLRDGGVVVAIAAAAQCCGAATRGLRGAMRSGFGWLPGGVVEPNFDPGHDRRLRQQLEHPGVRWGIGLPAESALLLGPDGAAELVGELFVLDRPDGELAVYSSEDP